MEGGREKRRRRGGDGARDQRSRHRVWVTSRGHVTGGGSRARGHVSLAVGAGGRQYGLVELARAGGDPAHPGHQVQHRACETWASGLRLRDFGGLRFGLRVAESGFRVWCSPCVCRCPRSVSVSGSRSVGARYSGRLHVTPIMEHDAPLTTDVGPRARVRVRVRGSGPGPGSASR